jgi:ParB/RepB/Spo0J family partition protein
MKDTDKTTSTSAAIAAVTNIPLTQIKPSPFNYRTTFEGIGELAGNIAAHGVRQPVKVRPLADGTYELVYGHRRYQASAEAGLKEIPALVEQLDDAAVMAEQLIENTQRADVHPIEEAEGFERLLKLTGPTGEPLYSATTLAVLVGRSAAHIYGRLKLTSLVPALRKACYKGELTAAVAVLLARVPPGLQETALKTMRQRHHGGGPIPLELAQRTVAQEFMLRLDTAPFPTGDKELVAAAGACGDCPKRTGNNKMLFGDVKEADVCTDPLCFRAKSDALWQRAVNAAQDSGCEVLADKRAKEIFSAGRLTYAGRSYIDLDDRCSSDPKNRTWRKLIGEADPKIIVARDDRGTVHYLVRQEAALAAIKDTPAGRAVAKIVAKGASHGMSAKEADEHRAREEKGRQEAFVRREVVTQAFQKIVAVAEKKEPDCQFWLIWLESVVRGSWHDTLREVAKRRGLPCDQKNRPEDSLRKAAAKMDGAQLRGLALEIALSRGAYGIAYGDREYGEAFTQACERYGVDLKELKKEAKGTLQEKITARRAKVEAKKAEPKKKAA